MPKRSDESLDLIGKRLREEWRDLVDTPLPERFCELLDEFTRAERALPQPPAEPPAPL
jgi:hypothetical protein